jgi:putative ABC transport system ATP-binding protein
VSVAARSAREEAGASRADGVRLEGVSKIYGRGEVAVHALKDINLSMPRGQLVVFLGPSGSGKTTLLNIIGGIDVPTQGRVNVDGEEITALNAGGLTDYRRRKVGFVFQFYNLVPTLTALENVELIAELTGARDVEARAQLAAVGLGDRIDHFPSALSGGEQQRVAIARALAKHPSLLLCDEPTGSLDLITGRTVLGVLRRLQQGLGITVLIVTHNSTIAGMADRVIRLRSGEIVDDRRNEHPISPEELEW